MFQFISLEISLNYDIKPHAAPFVLLDFGLITLIMFQFISLEFSLNYDIKPRIVTFDLDLGQITCLVFGFIML